MRVLLGISCFTAVVGIQSLLQRLNLTDRLERDPVSVTLRELERSDDFVSNVLIAQTGLAVLTGVVLLMWLWRVYKNIDGRWRARGTEFTPGWAVGWWFVPFANLVKPHGVMSEAWAASAPGYPSDSDLWISAKRSQLVSLWWAAVIASGLAARASALFAPSPDSGSLSSYMSGLRAEAWIAMVSRGLLIVAGALLIVIVGQINDRQDRRHAAEAADT